MSKYYFLLITTILVVGLGCVIEKDVERHHNAMVSDYSYWLGVRDGWRGKTMVWRIDNVPKLIHHFEAHHPDWTDITNVKKSAVKTYNSYITSENGGKAHSLEVRMEVAIEEGY